MKIEERLKKLNIILPKAPDPVGAYVASKISGNLIFISGQVSLEDGNLIKGKVGRDLDLDQARHAAKICGLNILSQLNKLKDLYNSGVLTKEEFIKAKKKILK